MVIFALQDSFTHYKSLRLLLNMANTLAGHWVNFFNASGIPTSAAATYAHIFVENRIQMDMLMDLNKEYLRDMGVTLMGDIISILRHAKTVCDQTAREKVLNSDYNLPLKTITDKSTTTAVIAKNKRKASAISRSDSPTTLSDVKSFQRKKIKCSQNILQKSDCEMKSSSNNTENCYADSKYKERNNIFQRLANNSKCVELLPTCTKYEMSLSQNIKNHNKNNCNTSIFSRLGNKSDDLIMVSKEIKPILKKPVSNRLSTMTKTNTISTMKPVRQQVIFVKKVPIKDNSHDEDNSLNYDDNNSNEKLNLKYQINSNGGNEKIVKFASTAEVREIASEIDLVGRNSSSEYSKQLHHLQNNLKKNDKLRMIKPNNYVKTSLNMVSDKIEYYNSPVHKRLGYIKRSVKVNPKLISSNCINSRQKHYAPSSISSPQVIQCGTSVFSRLGKL